MIALTCHGSRARKDLCISETAQQSLEWPIGSGRQEALFTTMFVYNNL